MDADTAHDGRDSTGVVVFSTDTVITSPCDRLVSISDETISLLGRSRVEGPNLVPPCGTPLPHGLSDGTLDLGLGESAGLTDFLVAYARLNNELCSRAKALIRAGSNTAGLAARIESLKTECAIRPENDGGIGEVAVALQNGGSEHAVDRINSILFRRVLELSTSMDRKEVELMSLQLAHITVAVEETRSQTIELARAANDHLTAFGSFYGEQREREPSCPATNPAEQLFWDGLEFRFQRFGKIPELLIFNDIDDNLGRTASNTALRPADAIDLLLDRTLDQIEISPGRQRVPIIHSLEIDPNVGEYVTQAYQSAGKAIDLFLDTPDVTARAAQADVNYQIMTGNVESFGDGVVSRITSDRLKVTGVTDRSVPGHEKPLYLLNAALTDPSRMVVLSDDRDSGIRFTISHGTGIPEFSDRLIPLQHLITFVCRIPGDAEADRFPLTHVLDEHSIPHFKNQAVRNGGGYDGYQGVNRLIELFELWKTTKG